MHQLFTDEEITTLSARIDAELLYLGTPGTGQLKSATPEEVLPVRQRQALETATGEEATSFIAKFKRAARQDICQPEGVLYQQWQKYRDITNKDVLQTFGGVLMSMGLAGNTLQIAVVALAVYVLYIGLTAFCEDK
jgi:hypothetical protein